MANLVSDMVNLVSAMSDNLAWGLACAVLSPGLRSVLVFDAPSAVLRDASAVAAEMLQVITEFPVTQVTLGTVESDDDLWGTLKLGGDEQEVPLTWQPGLLVGEQVGSGLQLVLIPDLTQLNLATARSGVMLIGADIAHLERHGQKKQWQPLMFWLAGCAGKNVGQVSPHLLDRFALRLNYQVPDGIHSLEERVAEIMEWISVHPSSEQIKLDRLSVQAREMLQRGVQFNPTLTDEAVNQILAYSTTLKNYTPRREIALARLAVAIAKLKAQTPVTATHVNDAAQLIGLPSLAVPTGIPQPRKLPVHPTPPEQPQQPSEDPDLVESKITLVLPNEGAVQPSQEPIYQTPSETLPPSSLPSRPITPYPEDQTPVEREATSLRLPPRRYQSSIAARGSVIGVERATKVHDIAWVSTLLEAAKFQTIRLQQTERKTGQLLILPTDLRTYRRSPVPEQMLVILLDYTCLSRVSHPTTSASRAWEDVLFPHLKWAYVERASVCLIQVGSGNARHELRAECLTAQSMLVPQLGAALEAKSGKATPLAHGLDLALQTLRHALQHGRNTVQYARFVVLSDGRGNVPLEASRSGYVTLPIYREGIDDALQVAQRIRSLDGVELFVLDPQPQAYRKLPLELAEALGATAIPIPLPELSEAE
ncbi:MAG TPA: hypothetical protein V6D26_09705 [Stenomitos sp.]